MGNATRASRGKPHIFLTVENRVGPASRFRDSQSTAQPLRLHFGLGFYSFGLFCNLIRLNSLIIGFLFVVPLPCYVASSIPNITVRDLPFTTLGCRYPRPDFHRLDVRHARRTNRVGGPISIEMGLPSHTARAYGSRTRRFGLLTALAP